MTYSIRLPEGIEKRLEYLSSQTGRTKSFYVAEKRLEDILSGFTQTIPLCTFAANE